MTDTADVVVCGRNDDRFRLSRLPPERDKLGLPKAETRVFGNAKLAVEGEQVGDGHFGVINRAMVRLKIPFGGAKKR